MAKKPAKRNSSNSALLIPKVDYGVQVLYIGSKSTMFVCPECGKQTRKGMIQEYKSELYCGKGCVSTFKRKTETSAGIDL